MTLIALFLLTSAQANVFEGVQTLDSIKKAQAAEVLANKNHQLALQAYRTASSQYSAAETAARQAETSANVQMQQLRIKTQALAGAKTATAAALKKLQAHQKNLGVMQTAYLKALAAYNAAKPEDKAKAKLALDQATRNRAAAQRVYQAADASHKAMLRNQGALQTQVTALQRSYGLARADASRKRAAANQLRALINVKRTAEAKARDALARAKANTLAIANSIQIHHIRLNNSNAILSYKMTNVAVVIFHSSGIRHIQMHNNKRVIQRRLIGQQVSRPVMPTNRTHHLNSGSFNLDFYGAGTIYLIVDGTGTVHHHFSSHAIVIHLSDAGTNHYLNR